MSRESIESVLPALMKPNLRIALILFLLVGCVLEVATNAIPISRPSGTLRRDGSVVLRPGEIITVKFDVVDGKLVSPTISSEFPMPPNSVQFSLLRSGGEATRLGPISQIRDTLRGTDTFAKSFNARCAFTTEDSKDPKKITITSKNSAVEHVFHRGVTEVTLFDFRVDAK